MQVHQLQPKPKQRKAKRIGRGGKRGTYSGRGMKGQKSRAGARFQPKIREILKRYPKRRGYRRSPYGDVISFNISLLEEHFESGDTISPNTLVAKHLVDPLGKRTLKIKILGLGVLTKKITVEKCSVSALAKEKIEKVGGNIM
jgi:large subunit ribosomal protein L15